MSRSLPQVVLATRNPGKGREIIAIYGRLGIDWLSPAGLGQAEEEGRTYAENAAAKARAAARAARLPALADDSGLEIDALGGAPGIRSARLLGPLATDGERNTCVLQMLADLPDSARTARFVAAAAVALPDGVVRVFEGVCLGRILNQPRGTGGFGYDPIFAPAGRRGSMAELPAAVKNRISHRARAFRAARPYVMEILRKRRQDRPAKTANSLAAMPSPVRKGPR